MTEDRSYNAGQRGIHEAFLDRTLTSYSNYKALPILRDANNGNSSGSGIMSFNKKQALSKT